MKLTKEQAEKRDRNRERGFAKWKANEGYQADHRSRLSRAMLKLIAKEPVKPVRSRKAPTGD